MIWSWRWIPLVILYCCEVNAIENEGPGRKRRLFHIGDIDGIIENYASAFGAGHGLSNESLGLATLYYSLVHIMRPSSILVIGSGEGTVPVIFAEAVRDLQELDKANQYTVSISVVDAHMDFQSGVWNQTCYDRMASEYPEIRVFQNYSHQIPSLIRAGQIPRPNIAMIDGDHTAVVALHDFMMIENLLAEPSAILLHDTLYPISEDHPPNLGSAVVVEFIRKHRATAWALIDFWFIGSGLALALPRTTCEKIYFDYWFIPRSAWYSGVCEKAHIYRGIYGLSKDDFDLSNSDQYPETHQVIADMAFFKEGDLRNETLTAEMVLGMTHLSDAGANGSNSMDPVGASEPLKDMTSSNRRASCIPGMIGDSCSQFLYQHLRDEGQNMWAYLGLESLKQRQVMAAASLRQFNVKSVFEVGGHLHPVIDFISHDLDRFVGVDPLIRPEWRSNVEGTAGCLRCRIREVRLLPCLLQDVISEKFDIGVPFTFNAVVVLGYDKVFGMQIEDLLHLLSFSSASIFVLEAAVDWPSSLAAMESLISSLVDVDWHIRMDVLLDLGRSPDVIAHGGHVFSRRRLVTLQRVAGP